MSLGLLCAAWAYAPAPANSQEKKNLRVVFTGLAWNSELPFRVALARGFFRAQGLDIQPIFVRGGPAALAALSSGEVDFAEIGGAQATQNFHAFNSVDVAVQIADLQSDIAQVIGQILGRAFRQSGDENAFLLFNPLTAELDGIVDLIL